MSKNEKMKKCSVCGEMFSSEETLDGLAEGALDTPPGGNKNDSDVCWTCQMVFQEIDLYQ